MFQRCVKARKTAPQGDPDVQTEGTLQQLPQEILIKVLSYTCPRQRARLATQSRSLRVASQAPVFWRSVSLTDFTKDHYQGCCPLPPCRSWRSMVSYWRNRQGLLYVCLKRYTKVHAYIEELDAKGVQISDWVMKKLVKSDEVDFEEVGKASPCEVAHLLSLFPALRVLKIPVKFSSVASFLNYTRHWRPGQLRLETLDIMDDPLEPVGDPRKFLPLLLRHSSHTLRSLELPNFEVDRYSDERDLLVSWDLGYDRLIVGIALSGQLPSLTALNAGCARDLAGIFSPALLASPPPLRHLNLHEAVTVTDADVDLLAKCFPRLETLELNTCGLSHKSLLSLAWHCFDLRMLTLFLDLYPEGSSWVSPGFDINMETWHALGRLPHLQRLTLEADDYSDYCDLPVFRGMVAAQGSVPLPLVHGFPELEILDLQGAAMEPGALQEVMSSIAPRSAGQAPLTFKWQLHSLINLELCSSVVGSATIRTWCDSGVKQVMLVCPALTNLDMRISEAPGAAWMLDLPVLTHLALEITGCAATHPASPHSLPWWRAISFPHLTHLTLTLSGRFAPSSQTHHLLENVLPLCPLLQELQLGDPGPVRASVLAHYRSSMLRKISWEAHEEVTLQDTAAVGDEAEGGGGGDEVLDDSSRLAQYSLGELAYNEAVLEVVLPPHHFSRPQGVPALRVEVVRKAHHGKRPMAFGTSRFCLAPTRGYWYRDLVTGQKRCLQGLRWTRE